MWTRGVAIRPVPSHAVVSEHTVEKVREAFADDDDAAQKRLDEAFVRFEATQPDLTARLNEIQSKRLDETALALGYFLGVAVWLSFDRQFGDRVRPVDAVSLAGTQAAFDLETELRASQADEPLDTDDVVALEQPAVVAFVQEHIEAALEQEDVDVDDVHIVYRAILVELLSLSQAVAPHPGAALRSGEVLA